MGKDFFSSLENPPLLMSKKAENISFIFFCLFYFDILSTFFFCLASDWYHVTVGLFLRLTVWNFRHHELRHIWCNPLLSSWWWCNVKITSHFNKHSLSHSHLANCCGKLSTTSEMSERSRISRTCIVSSFLAGFLMRNKICFCLNILKASTEIFKSKLLADIKPTNENGIESFKRSSLRHQRETKNRIHSKLRSSH